MSGDHERGRQLPLFSSILLDETSKVPDLPQHTAKTVDSREVVVPALLPCLSIRQPWAGWNIDGDRQFEIRTWDVNYRGLLLIHAGKKIDISDHPTKAIPSHYFSQTGAILGYAILEDVARISDAQMWEDLRPMTLEFGLFPSATVYAWKLRMATRFPTLIPLRGQLGLQKVSVDKIMKFIADIKGEAAAETVLAQLREAQAEFLRIKK